MRAGSSDGTSACLTNKRTLVRLQPRPSLWPKLGSVERPPETRGVAGSTPAGHTEQDSVAQRRAPGSYPGKRWFEPSRGHRKDCHWSGTPSRKRVGPRALGVRLPLLPPGGMAEMERQRVATAQAAESPLASSSLAASASPRSSAESEQWASTPRAPVRIGPGRLRCDVVQPVGRPAVTRRMLVRAQPSQLQAPIV